MTSKVEEITEKLLESKKEKEMYPLIKELIELMDFNFKLVKGNKKNGNNYDFRIDYRNQILSLMEVKLPNSNEFNIEIEGETISLYSRGNLFCFKPYILKLLNPKEPDYQWIQFPNCGGDGIGQIRGYFYTLLYLNPEQLHFNAFAILTNGEYWVIFEYRKSPNKEEIIEIAKEGLRPCFIKHLKGRDSKDKLLNGDKIYWCKLPEDWETLKEYFAEKIEEIKSTNPR